MALELDIDDEENNANFQLDIDANAPEMVNESWENDVSTKTNFFKYKLTLFLSIHDVKN